jgi:hypothetical protein
MRRFIHRRTLVWLIIVAAVAALIGINERRQEILRTQEREHQAVTTPAEPGETRHQPLPPAEMRAAPSPSIKTDGKNHR